MRYLLRHSPIVLRHAPDPTRPFERAALDDVDYGELMEVRGMTRFTPYGGDMQPLDRPWDDPDPWKED